MAEEYCGGSNWWDSSPSVNRNRFDGGSGIVGGSSTSSSTTTTPSNTEGVCGFGWLTDDHPKIVPSVVQLSGLGLTSGQGLDWNHQYQPQHQRLLNSDKGENNFHDDTTNVASTMFSSQLQWRDKLFGGSNGNSSEFKQLGFSIDDHHELISPISCSSMESTVTCQGLSTSPASFHLDSPSSSILQGFMGAHQHQQMNYHNNNNYLGLDNNKVHQFSNNSTYLNVDIVRPNLMASFQGQLPMPVFEEKPKLRNTIETFKNRGGSDNNTKRTRSETATSTLPPFKVRKEKMGDRITALQQLVSPFGKTDTASVLSEAIEYIKFLHEQVGVLSTPYLKNGAASYQQDGEKERKVNVGQKQDLKSRGLCLVPVSSTFPMTHETTVDFWTPTFGGTFR